MAAAGKGGGADWAALAESLGAFESMDGHFSEASSSDSAAEIVCNQLGDDFLLSAVDHYVSAQPGMASAQSVLRLLRPSVAMQRCNQIIANSKDESQRESSMELLRSIADHRALCWLPDYLADENLSIRVWAIYMIMELVPATISPEDVEGFIEMLPSEQGGNVGRALEQLREEVRKYDAI